MLNRLRERTAARDIFVALAALVLALKLLFPPGFMPGTSLAQPIVLCSAFGPMPAMAMPGMTHGGDHKPGTMPHGASDHACPFAGLGATPLTPDMGLPDFGGISLTAAPHAIRLGISAPGRGMAAPPPPSQAPPAVSA